MRVIIHIGQQKTGSTSLQAWLTEHREALAERGILYSRALGNKKAALLPDLVRKPRKVPDLINEVRHALREELTGPWHTAIMSEENLFSLTSTQVVALRDLLSGPALNCEIFAYVRPPHRHVVSDYQQRVQGFYDGTLAEFVQMRIKYRYYVYGQRLGFWSDAFGRPAVHARLLSTQDPGALVADLIGWTELTKQLQGLDLTTHALNPAIDPLSIEVLRAANAWRARNPGRLGTAFIKTFASATKKTASHARTHLPAASADDLAAAFGRDLRTFACDYLAPDEANCLLAPAPRKLEVTSPSIDAQVTRAVEVFAAMKSLRIATGRPRPVTRRSSIDGPILESLGENRFAAGSRAARLARRLRVAMRPHGTSGDAPPLDEVTFFPRLLAIAEPAGLIVEGDTLPEQRMTSIEAKLEAMDRSRRRLTKRHFKESQDQD